MGKMKDGLKADAMHLRTICEVHRELYDLAYENLAGDVLNIFETKLEEAYVMAKKMDGKLRQYKNNYDNDWWESIQDDIRKSTKELRQNRK